MGYQKEREEFLVRFAREFPEAPITFAAALLRHASSAQRYNEIVTSIDVGQKELDRLERVSEKRRERVEAICQKIGAGVEFNGDPRGFPFFVKCPSGYANDWGRRGLGVPGRSLPARCFQ